jgi:Zn-dependent peptidase ImmA (M78 family)
MFDIGIGKARDQAARILEAYGLECGGDADLRDLAYDRGLFVIDQSMTGAEGRLVRRGKRAIAAISNRIQYEGKRSFVIAHEMGHFELHQSSPLFLCDDSDFIDWHSRRPEETEANEFAAELLMPTDYFRREASATEFSLEEVRQLSELCGVSLTAAAVRLVKLDVVPSALAFCQHGEIKWSMVSKSFPYQYMKYEGRPDGYSGAGEFYSNGDTSEEAAETPADAWFTDYELEPDAMILEQCLIMSNLNATLSFISQV